MLKSDLGLIGQLHLRTCRTIQHPEWEFQQPRPAVDVASHVRNGHNRSAHHAYKADPQTMPRVPGITHQKFGIIGVLSWGCTIPSVPTKEWRTALRRRCTVGTKRLREPLPGVERGRLLPTLGKENLAGARNNLGKHVFCLDFGVHLTFSF